MALMVRWDKNAPTLVIHSFGLEPQLPITGPNPSPNIARIFGTNTTAFELLALKRKIMGPCWLVIKNPKIENKSVSLHPFEAPDSLNLL
jgi:DNA polymerase alpha subunit A